MQWNVKIVYDAFHKHNKSSFFGIGLINSNDHFTDAVKIS